MKIYKDITQTIGHTPLVGLKRMTKGIGAQVVLKLESFNPLSSVKDRIGVSMIDDAEKRGVDREGFGNHGTHQRQYRYRAGLRAAARGYRLILTMPDTMSLERRQLLQMFGAELVCYAGRGRHAGGHQKSERTGRNDTGGLFLQQFDNPANPEIHRKTTAEEIWHDTDGKVDIVVSGVGTGGTITGVAEVIKTRKKDFQAVAVEPEGSPVLSGGTRSAQNTGHRRGICSRCFEHEYDR